MSSPHVSLLRMTINGFDSVHLCGAGRLCGVGRPYGQKVSDVDRRADQQPKKISWERQMHNKEEIKTQARLVRFVDLILLHLPL
jgi:hypothetical protein